MLFISGCRRLNSTAKSACKGYGSRFVQEETSDSQRARDEGVRPADRQFCGEGGPLLASKNGLESAKATTRTGIEARFTQAPIGHLGLSIWTRRRLDRIILILPSFTTSASSGIEMERFKQQKERKLQYESNGRANRRPVMDGRLVFDTVTT
ncbi:hypothetical protein NA57DRAFT_57782 [Rhizodiscina lignyota]|uniref:Uncharacterized protein n=1 Tax=Rhizodiscina lignyota TaxID=1504668 RepID=A0A9P4M7B4_9PEZI|nr:hypothetical protein NA57DRAFT_57782 [Rhizodiscina lignyota]